MSYSSPAYLHHPPLPQKHASTVFSHPYTTEFVRARVVRLPCSKLSPQKYRLTAKPKVVLTRDRSRDDVRVKDRGEELARVRRESCSVGVTASALQNCPSLHPSSLPFLPPSLLPILLSPQSSSLLPYSYSFELLLAKALPILLASTLSAPTADLEHSRYQRDTQWWINTGQQVGG